MHPRRLLSLLCVLLSLSTLLALSQAATSPARLYASSSSWIVSGREAHVAVWCAGCGEAPLGVTIELHRDGAAADAQPLAIQSASLNSDSSFFTRAALLVPQNLSDGLFLLRVVAAGLADKVEMKVALSGSSTAVFAETDKSMYQPAQTVRLAIMAGQNQHKQTIARS